MKKRNITFTTFKEIDLPLDGFLFISYHNLLWAIKVLVIKCWQQDLDVIKWNSYSIYFPAL